MAKVKLALCIPLNDADMKKVEEYCEVTKAGPLGTGVYDLPEETICEQCMGNEIIITDMEESGRGTLQRWKDAGLKLLISARGTPATIDWQAVHDLGIPLAHIPGRNSVAVSEYCLGLMINLIKKMPRAIEELRKGTFAAPPKEDIYNYVEADSVDYPMSEGSPYDVIGMGTELYGKTIGIVGYGAIGRKVAHICQAFHMDVMAYDPYFSADIMKEEGVTPASLDELIPASDFISIHLPVNNETRKMVNDSWFERMKPTACLINTARAAVIDQRALVEALQQKKIAGAAMDVMWEEPTPQNHPLFSMDNVIITPHMGAMTVEIQQDWTSRMVTEHIINYCTGKPITTLWTRTQR